MGAKPHHARSLAEVLVTADCRGHYSHGLNRMGQSKLGNIRNVGVFELDSLAFWGESGLKCAFCFHLSSLHADMYLKDIQTGICAVEGEPLVEKESAATALVDGNNLLGPVVGNFCMKLAIKKAKEVGIGWVVAHGESHHFSASVWRP